MLETNRNMYGAGNLQELNFLIKIQKKYFITFAINNSITISNHYLSQHLLFLIHPLSPALLQCLLFLTQTKIDCTQTHTIIIHIL